MACPRKVERHSPAHVAEAYETDFRMFSSVDEGA